MRRRRTAVATFSLSFLDCICCGLGAVLLLFVLTAGTKADPAAGPVADLQAEARRLEGAIESTRTELRAVAALLEREEALRRRLLESTLRREASITDRTAALQLLLSRSSDLEQTLATLLGELAALPTTPDRVPVPRPNPIRRQYLTDFKLNGERVLVLVEASGSMLDETVDTASARVALPEADRRAAPKWRRVVAGTEWIIGSLREPSRFQVVLYGAEPVALGKARGDWVAAGDRAAVADLLDGLRSAAPRGPANLERALGLALAMDPPPDNVVLLTDGYPTAAESIPGGPLLDEATRRAMFEAARRRFPPRVPVNVLFFPWSEDPSAPSAFWILAVETNGAFVAPARSWPDTGPSPYAPAQGKAPAPPPQGRAPAP